MSLEPAGSLPEPATTTADLPHDSLHGNIIAAAIGCWVVAAIFVALRVYTRAWMIRAFGISDWCILLSLLFSAATSAGELEQVVHGSGRHVWDLDPTDRFSGMAWVRASWYTILFYTLSLCFTKISILCLYLHVFTFQWVRRAGQVILGIVIVTNIYTIIVICLACIPLQAYWDYTVRASYCHRQSIWWSNTGLHMATDFLIFLLPMPVVWRLKLPRQQKYVLFAIFGLGFFTCFISILRLWNLIGIETNPDPDYTYASASLTIWTVVEINCGVVVAAIMTLKPLANRLFPLFLGTTLSRRETRPSTDDHQLPPPTIGSRPSKDPFYGTAHHHSWPHDFYEFGDGGHVMSEMERKDPKVTNEIAKIGDAPMFDAEAEGAAGGRDNVPSPQASHPSGRDTANTFYTSSSDMTATTLLPTRSQG